MKQEKKCVKISVSITPKQKEFLDKRQDINISGFIRLKIDELMQEN